MSAPPTLRELATAQTWDSEGPVAMRETHASWVFLTGDRAYKVKKPVRLAFLDYGTLSRRREACLEEVRVNRELSPDLYLGVRTILRDGGGRLRLGPEDAPGALEYAVEMLRFDEADTVEELLASGRLTPAHIRAIGALIAGFHRSATPVAGGEPQAVMARWKADVAELRRLAHPVGWDLDLMGRFCESFLRRGAREIEGRVREGLVRDGHGDLRCEHVLAGDRVRLVDRIEFDPALRRIDVSADLAFLAMDLEAKGRRRAVEELLDAYRAGGGDPGSRELFSFYCAQRALVRAKVALLRAAQLEGGPAEEALARAEGLWHLAELLCWRARGPLAIVVCGPAASGKSTLARELARRSDLRVVSSDALRKRMAGLAATDRAGPELYTAERTRATYEMLARETEAALQEGRGVIVDATCRSRGDRAALLATLRRHQGAWLFVRCVVSRRTLLARAAARMGSPERVSDATPEIAAEQASAFEDLDEVPAGNVLELDAEQPPAARARAVIEALDGVAAST